MPWPGLALTAPRARLQPPLLHLLLQRKSKIKLEIKKEKEKRCNIRKRKIRIKRKMNEKNLRPRRNVNQNVSSFPRLMKGRPR